MLDGIKVTGHNADMKDTKFTRLGIALTEPDMLALKKLKKALEPEHGKVGNTAAIRCAIRLALGRKAA